MPLSIYYYLRLFSSATGWGQAVCVANGSSLFANEARPTHDQRVGRPDIVDVLAGVVHRIKQETHRVQPRTLLAV